MYITGQKVRRNSGLQFRTWLLDFESRKQFSLNLGTQKCSLIVKNLLKICNSLLVISQMYLRNHSSCALQQCVCLPLGQRGEHRSSIHCFQTTKRNCQQESYLLKKEKRDFRTSKYGKIRLPRSLLGKADGTQGGVG